MRQRERKRKSAIMEIIPFHFFQLIHMVQSKPYLLMVICNVLNCCSPGNSLAYTFPDLHFSRKCVAKLKQNLKYQ